MTLKESLKQAYNAHYKKLMVFSFILLFACITVLAVSYIKTGEFFEKGVSLKGGITITAKTTNQVEVNELEKILSKKHPKSDINIRETTERGKITSLIIEASDINAEELKNSLIEQGIQLEQGNYSIESMGGSLGQRFFSQTIKALIFAFIAMAIVVFITFRTAVPSIFVVLAAVSDIISTLAVINIAGIKLSTAGIAALLMLIGYSVDTDILLTTKVLKRRTEGVLTERITGAMKTGLTMTITSLVAAIIGLFFTNSEVIRQIMFITATGLCFDIIYTWCQNAGILRWYMEKKYGEN